MTPILIAGAIVALLIAIPMLSAIRMARRKGPGHTPLRVELSDEAIRGFLRNGDKIQAIKAYRELHRVGLKEAKDKVEELERDAKSPV